MSLVCCFVAIARRLGIPCTPLNTQLRVIACLGGTLVDVCDGNLLPSPPSSEERAQKLKKLLFDHRTVNDMSMLMLGRSARNIRVSIGPDILDFSINPQRFYQYSNAMYASRCVFTHIEEASGMDVHRGGISVSKYSSVLHRIDRRLPLTESFIPGNTNDFETAMQNVETFLGLHWTWLSPSKEYRRSESTPPLFVGQVARVRAENCLCIIVGWRVSEHFPNRDAYIVHFYEA